jgi:ribosomal protein S18 acetylase RimI-like enzyme
VRIEADGSVTAFTGSVNQGQDHQTTFAQIVADRLGVPFEAVSVRQGDTADNLPGIGTFGSRSTALGGGGLAVVADEVFEQGRRIAAHLLEAAPEDVVARGGRFSVVGVGASERSVSWADVAAAARGGTLPDAVAASLDARTRFDPGSEAFAFGACGALVEVEPSTGVVRLRRLVLVHDCGTPINPRLVEAQLHGGIAQGVGEALGEWLRFDEAGQLLAGSLMDYWVPHADDLPSFELAATITPTTLNRLGAKGVGEAGTIAAPSAVLHAVLDALSPLGVSELDFPLTPERVWRAIAASPSIPNPFPHQGGKGVLAVAQPPKTPLPRALGEGQGERDVSIRQITQLTPGELSQLADLLIAVVDGGASVGFLPPLGRAEAEVYWRGVLDPGVVLFVAERAGAIVGTVQLQLALRANARHRAEVAKLLVHPSARRQGLGRRLMTALEAEAQRLGRTLLFLDTREGDVSNDLYRGLGYQEVGRIPRYARSASGDLDGTVIYYKELA